jgi:Tol biopolymer transport system component
VAARLCLLAITGTLLLAVPPSTSSSESAFPGRNGLIAFSSGRGGRDLSIYTIRSDGSGVRRVTRARPPSGTSPAYSPDGRTIAFGSQSAENGTELWLAPTHGGRAYRLLGGLDAIPPDLDWSPDGRRLVFESGAALWVVRADGRGKRRLTGDGAYEPDWSPDGRHIAFSHSFDGVFVLDLRTKRIRRVGPGAEPAWSPDGKQIVSAHATCSVCAYNLYVMDADGGRLRQITSFHGDDSAESPAWSPDGRLIAFDRCCGGIYVVRPDGSDVRRLFARLSDVEHPAWKPGGHRIAFDVGDSRLYVMNADGTGARPFFTRPSGPATEPKWDPAARRIAFVRSDGLHLTRADGSREQRLGPLLTSPSWAPSGKQMAVGEGGGISILTLATGRIRDILVDEGAWDTSKFAPAWSPNGRTIAYLDEDELSLYTVGGGRKRHLGLRASGGLSWSPDGRRIAYSLDNEIRVADVRSRAVQRLGSGSSPGWSPDGRWIAYVRGRGVRAEIYVFDQHGRNGRRLTHNRAPDTDPDWARR